MEGASSKIVGKFAEILSNEQQLLKNKNSVQAFKSLSIPYTSSQYNSVVFDLTKEGTPVKIEKEDVELFKNHISERLSEFKNAKKRSIWFKIPQSYLFLLEPMVQDLNFDIHHCSDHNRKENPYIMLCKWLETSERNGLPPNPPNYNGVGAMCIDWKFKEGKNGKKIIDLQNSKIVLVQERFTPSNGIFKNFWHLPGGGVDAAEELFHAAERELREETGVKGKFRGIFGMMHKRFFRFERGDIYFICLLDAQSDHVRAQPEEIAAAKWFSLEEYFTMDFGALSGSANLIRACLQKFIESGLDDKILMCGKDISHLIPKFLKHASFYSNLGGIVDQAEDIVGGKVMISKEMVLKNKEYVVKE